MNENVFLLPKVIKLHNYTPGEPQFIGLRQGKVARMRKFNILKDVHEYYLSELQPYMPFLIKSDLGHDSIELCLRRCDETSEHNTMHKITNVIEGTEKPQELTDSNRGAVLDTENKQD